MGMRFTYRFLRAGVAIPADVDTLVRLTEGTTIDIEVSVEPFGPDGSIGEPVPYLPTRSGALSLATAESALTPRILAISGRDTGCR